MMCSNIQDMTNSEMGKYAVADNNNPRKIIKLKQVARSQNRCQHNAAIHPTAYKFGANSIDQTAVSREVSISPVRTLKTNVKPVCSNAKSKSVSCGNKHMSEYAEQLHNGNDGGSPQWHTKTASLLSPELSNLAQLHRESTTSSKNMTAPVTQEELFSLKQRSDGIDTGEHMTSQEGLLRDQATKSWASDRLISDASQAVSIRSQGLSINNVSPVSSANPASLCFNSKSTSRVAAGAMEQCPLRSDDVLTSKFKYLDPDEGKAISFWASNSFHTDASQQVNYHQIIPQF